MNIYPGAANIDALIFMGRSCTQMYCTWYNVIRHISPYAQTIGRLVKSVLLMKTNFQGYLHRQCKLPNAITPCQTL